MKRRSFLYTIGAIGSIYPIKELLKLITHAPNSSSFSRLERSETRNYFQFNMYGGPTRWNYDHLLKPFDEDIFYQHPMVGNEFVTSSSGEIQSLAYNIRKYKQVNVPTLWHNHIPTTSNDQVKMTNLLDNCLMVRGIHHGGLTGHPMVCSKLIAPSLGGMSINGVLADRSQKPFKSISIGNTPLNRAYKSHHSSATNINSDHVNYLHYLLDPLSGDGKKGLPSTKEIESAIDEALDNLKTSNNSLSNDLHSARRFFRQSIDGLLADYDLLLKKYKDLISRALKTRIEGVTSNKLVPKLHAGKIENVDQVYGAYKLIDKYLLDDDLRTILDDVEIETMAQEFALTEYVLINGLSSSIVVSCKNEIGNILKNIISKRAYSEESLKSADGKFRTNIVAASFDSHATGSYINLLTTSQYYLSLASCLNELISRLKETKIGNISLFDETLIHISSEFDRIPDDLLCGSAHNEQAHSSTFYSGAIKGPQVVGNIFTSLNSSNKKWGTIGNSAPIKSFNNQRLNIGHLSSSIAAVLRINPLIKRANPFLELKNEQVHLTVDKAQNIEGAYEDFINS
ncbi:hypothetical protein [Halobacteriovorax sp. HLS]|uniref:hypothetical protein n=1 Tax=Halobacteriovorax sp. HLS TaxID=2234000 RepID=UPI000FD9726E|nr:hypothetical protein [Halobacteriovorax sp. HLS]